MSWYLSLWEALPSEWLQVAEANGAGWTISRLLEPGSIATLAVILGCGTGLVAVIGHYVSETIKARSLNQLKCRMLEQGHSPEDIERVVRAGPTKGAESES